MSWGDKSGKWKGESEKLKAESGKLNEVVLSGKEKQNKMENSNLKLGPLIIIPDVQL